MNPRERIEELEEEVRQLRALLDERLSHQWPREWRLTMLESRFLSAVVKAPGSYASKEYLFNAIYGHRDDAPSHKVFDQVVCQIRRKLPADQSSRLKTVYGHGWMWEREPQEAAS